MPLKSVQAGDGTEYEMYKRYATVLLLINMLFGVAFLNDEGKEFLERLGMLNDIQNVEVVCPEAETQQVICDYNIISGNCPVLEVWSVDRTQEIALNEADKLILYKIVEAEAGSEDRIGKILVANVVINRLQSASFPDSVEEVVFQQEDGVAQFSPVINGTYETAVPNRDTIEAVEAALGGEDYSKGALYFVARQYADSENVRWFDETLEKVVAHGGHEFYK